MQKSTLKKKERFEALLAQGLSKSEAARKMGVNNTAYYSWLESYKNHLKRTGGKDEQKPTKKAVKKSNPYNVLPISNMEEKGFELKGSPKQIAQFLKEMANQFGGQQ